MLTTRSLLHATRRRTTRVAALLTGMLALAVAAAAPGIAAEVPTPGIGSSSGVASVLAAGIGADALVLRLIGEDSQTSNDPGAGGPRALERVSPLSLTSTLVPTLGSISQPALQTSSTSGEDTTSSQAVSLGSLVSGAPLPGIVGGTIDPIALRSAVDPSGAVSSATGAVHGLSLLGGLLSTGTASVSLGSTALVTHAGAVRGMQLDRLDALDLSSLLSAMGISLSDLPIDVAVGLLDRLGLPLPGGLTPGALLSEIDALLAETSVVRSQVTALQGQIDTLQGQLALLVSQLSTATALVSTLTSQLAVQQALLDACVLPILCDPLQTIVASLTSQLATASSSVTSLEASIDAVQAQIDGLVAQIQVLLDTIGGALDLLLGHVNAVLDGLGGASLLSLRDLVVGVTARADDTLGSSVASVVGSVGDVQVGGVSLGGLDVGATTAQLTALSALVTSALGELLGTIDAGLAGLVRLSLLDRVTSLDETDGVTTASAAITALRAAIAPPDVCAVLGRLGAVQETLGTVLVGLGDAAAPLRGPVGDLLGTLGSTVSCNLAQGVLASTTLVNGVATVLTQPATVEALSLAGSGTYMLLGSSTPGAGTPGSLPATGGDTHLTLLALSVAVLGLGGRWLLRRSARGQALPAR